MRLPTPSMRRRDGVEGDVYDLLYVVLCSGQPGSPLFLVCYCDASCSYRAVLLLGRVTGAAPLVQRVLLCK